MTQQALTEEHVPLYSRISISAADAAIAILQTVVGGGALTYYYTRVAGLDEGKAGLVWLIFGIWNAINDPLFGFISDRTKSNLGRRIPYIRYGAPIIALGFILFWINFSNTQAVLFWQMLISLFIYDTLYTAIATSIYIMPFEMAVSNKARSTIFIWKIIFMIPPNVFPFVLASIQPGPGEDPTNYRWFMIGLAAVVCLIVIASTFFYKENTSNKKKFSHPSSPPSKKASRTSPSSSSWSAASPSSMHKPTSCKAWPITLMKSSKPINCPSTLAWLLALSWAFSSGCANAIAGVLSVVCSPGWPYSLSVASGCSSLAKSPCWE